MMDLFALLVLGMWATMWHVSFVRTKRDVARLEQERLARVAEQERVWRDAHPQLAAQGVPAPPTVDSVSRWVVQY